MIKHPTDVMLADFLDDRLPRNGRRQVEAHIAECDECLCKVVTAYESAGRKRKGKSMGRINLYLVLALLSFALSFIVPRFFLQLLVATLLLGIKWVADSKSTKMLVMIYEAWKSGGEKEASRIFEALDLRRKV